MKVDSYLLHKIVLYPHTLVPSSHSENRNAPPTKLPKFTQSLNHSLHPQPCLPCHSSNPVSQFRTPPLFSRLIRRHETGQDRKAQAGRFTALQFVTPQKHSLALSPFRIASPSPSPPARPPYPSTSAPSRACLPGSSFFLWLVLFFLTPAAAATISVRPISTLRPGFPNPSPGQIKSTLLTYSRLILSLFLSPGTPTRLLLLFFTHSHTPYSVSSLNNFHLTPPNVTSSSQTRLHQITHHRILTVTLGRHLDFCAFGARHIMPTIP